jgi:hypothetical protein
MDTKDYINYFSELSEFEPAKQEAILEQARYQAFTKMGLAGKSASFTALSWLSVLLLPALVVFFWGYDVIINSLAIGLGILLSLVIQKRLNGYLLRQGLQKVLSGNGT